MVHAKATGAWGEFEVTNKDISSLTTAKFLSSPGKKTQVLFRLSTVGGEKGSADTVRDVRGFAVKFFTEQGNFDIVGNDIVRSILSPRLHRLPSVINPSAARVFRPRPRAISLTQ